MKRVNNDVFAAVVPQDVDPADPAQRETLLAVLDSMAREWVWRQWDTTGRPLDVDFAASEWVITNQVANVDDFQPDHNCAECRAGNERTKAFLRANPGQWVAMANLTYTEIWPENTVLT